MDRRTLDDVDPPAWGPPDCDSYLVKTCHDLRRKPLDEFAVEDLRIMIGQRICLPWLVPLALDELWKNPLVEGDFYPGDLLVSVLRVDLHFWREHANLAAKLDLSLDRLPDDHGELTEEIKREIGGLVDAFRAMARELRNQ